MILHHPPSSHSNHAGHVEMLCWDLVYTRYEIKTTIVRVTMVSEQGGKASQSLQPGWEKWLLIRLARALLWMGGWERNTEGKKGKEKLCFPPLLCLSPCINSREWMSNTCWMRIPLGSTLCKVPRAPSRVDSVCGGKNWAPSGSDGSE